VRDGNLELYVMNSDGPNPIRLTDFAGKDYTGFWSPNGRQIAIVSNRFMGEYLWVMNPRACGHVAGHPPLALARAPFAPFAPFGHVTGGHTRFT
jgi:hypothetical protein